jgi:hypothetical protein
MTNITETSAKAEIISNACDAIDTLQAQINEYQQRQIILQGFVVGLLLILVVF